MDNSKVIIKSGNINAWIFGGSLSQSNGATVIEGNSSVEISGGTISGQVFGGSYGWDADTSTFQATVKGDTSVKLTGGTVTGYVFGGSLQIATSIEAALMPTFTAIRLLKSPIMHLWTEAYLADP